MSSSSINYEKWDKSFEEPDEDDTFEGDNRPRSTLPLHSLLNSVQLLKRVADEKLMEGEKLQELSTYLDAIQLYKEILDRIQRNDHFLDGAVEQTGTSDHSEIKKKLVVILYSCHLNIACGAIRCKLFEDALRHCDLAISLLMIYPQESDEALVSLLRAKYFKCFALLQLGSVEDIENANTESLSMKQILATRFAPEQRGALLKDYAELFHRIETRRQRIRQEGAAEVAAVTSSTAEAGELQSEQPAKPLPPTFPRLGEEPSDRRQTRLQQILAELEDCQRQGDSTKVSQPRLAPLTLHTVLTLTLPGRPPAARVERPRPQRALSGEELVPAGRLRREEQVSSPRPNPNPPLTLTACPPRNFAQADRDCDEAVRVLNEALEDCEAAERPALEYQLAQTLVGNARAWQQQLAQLETQGAAAESQAEAFGRVVRGLVLGLELLERQALLLRGLLDPRPLDGEDWAGHCERLGVAALGKDFAYRQLQVPPKLSAAQELAAPLSSADAAVTLSQSLLSLLACYEQLAEALRGRRQFFDCFLVLVRAVQCISSLQEAVDQLETDAAAANGPQLSGQKNAGPSAASSLSPVGGLRSGMAGSPSSKRKNTGPFYIYSSPGLTALMVLVHKRQTVGFFRLGLLLRSQLPGPLVGFSAAASFFRQAGLLYPLLTAPPDALPDRDRLALEATAAAGAELFSLVRCALFRQRKEQAALFFAVGGPEAVRDSALNCLERAGNELFYLLEAASSFTALKLCGELLLEKHGLPALQTCPDHLAVLLGLSATAWPGLAPVAAEEAERVADVWRLAKKSAEKVWTAAAPSGSPVSAAEKFRYQLEAVLALYQSGLCLLAASPAAGLNQLAQRALESAQALQQEAEAFVTASSASAAAFQDFFVLAGDVAYSLGLVYLRAGKFTYAAQELEAARQSYGRFFVPTASLGPDGRPEGWELLRGRLRNALGLLAFVRLTAQQTAEAEAIFGQFEELFLGPVEGKDPAQS